MEQFEKVLKGFPEGAKNHNFLKQLLKNLEPDGLRKSVRKELNESHADVSESIQNYFKQHIIYTSALKAVECKKSLQTESSHDDAELFYLNLLKKYVNEDKSCEKLKFFEGSQRLLAKILEDKQKSKSMQTFTKLVEDNLNEFFIQFSEYVLERKVHLCDWEKDFTSAIKQLSNTVASSGSTDIRLKAFSTELQNLLSTYYMALADGIEILNKILELFQQKVACQLNQSTVASDRSVLLKFKIKCLELEIMISTYSENAVNALKIIAGELKKKIDETVASVNKSKKELEVFQLLGPEYDQLVEKYQQLIENIETQKSAISYLRAELAAKEN